MEHFCKFSRLFLSQHFQNDLQAIKFPSEVFEYISKFQVHLRTHKLGEHHWYAPIAYELTSRKLWKKSPIIPTTEATIWGNDGWNYRNLKQLVICCLDAFCIPVDADVYSTFNNQFKLQESFSTFSYLVQELVHQIISFDFASNFDEFSEYNILII